MLFCSRCMHSQLMARTSTKGCRRVIFSHLPCFSRMLGTASGLLSFLPSCLVECAPLPERVLRNGARNMHLRRRRRKTCSARTDRQTRRFWTSQKLLIQQQARLGMREYDARQPACHYNLHIQPACGGLDYHNYHIRYLGIREDKHVWSVVDAPSGQEKSHRVYAFSKEHFIREVIDAASSLLVTDMTNDVGDPSLWANLCEHLALVLFDLYRYDLEKTSGGLLRKKPDQERRS